MPGTCCRRLVKESRTFIYGRMSQGGEAEDMRIEEAVFNFVVRFCWYYVVCLFLLLHSVFYSKGNRDLGCFIFYNESNKRTD